MKITQVEVDGFGVWSGLRLEELSDQITVFYGANEAGKTTLMQFVRTVFYGLSPERRQKYLGIAGQRKIANGKLAGGSLYVTGSEGPLQIRRHALGSKTTGGEGKVTVTTADGTTHSEAMLLTTLQGIDESIYNNVFAIGLGELQELATLSDTDAATSLYNLTVGMDRVSVREVIGDLDRSLGRLLTTNEAPKPNSTSSNTTSSNGVLKTDSSDQNAASRSQITDLMARRDKLKAEIEQLGSLTSQWETLTGRERRLAQSIAQIEEEMKGLEQRARTIELAMSVQGKWAQREVIAQQLAGINNHPAIDESSLGDLERLNQRLDHRRGQWNAMRRRRKELRDEAAQLNVNDRLWRLAPRIEALADQNAWISSLRAQADEAEASVRDIESRLDVACRRAGMNPSDADYAVEEIPSHVMTSLRLPARSVREARRRLETAREETKTAERTVNSTSTQIRTALASRPENDLGAALDAAGERASLLRQRVQIDERIDQASRNREDLELQSGESIQQQILPLWMLATIGGVFALGVLLLIIGFFVTTQPIGSLGIFLAALGFVGFGAAAIIKLVLDRSSTQQLEKCHRQIELIDRQIEQWKKEREELDRQIPRGGGPLASRLQVAQRDLSSLEDLLPLDAQRLASEQDYLAAQQRVEDAEVDLDTAQKSWVSALLAAGLPGDLAPRQVREVAGGNREIIELRNSLTRRREEARQRRQELDALKLRIRSLADEAGIEFTGLDASETLQNLLEASSRQNAQAHRLDEIQRRARSIKRKQSRCKQSGAKLRARIRRLLMLAGVDNEDDYRGLYEQAARVRILNGQHLALTSEIRESLKNQIEEEEMADLFQNEATHDLEARWEELTTELDSLDAKLKHNFQTRGEISAQKRQLGEDRRLPEKQLELGMIEAKLEQTIETWQVQAVTRSLLETIRREYEKNRQPQTLVEASEYLTQLTDGRYSRVWTPLGEEVLFVENEHGDSLPVEVLSRGTREQLFLSLRLSLVSMYARRGIVLPLVLDDVLVNFDVVRAKAAARVLKQFAKSGRQLLVFTCHEHIWKIFKAMRVDSRRLPDRSTPRRLAPVSQRVKSELTSAVFVNEPLIEIEEDELAAEEVLVPTPEIAAKLQVVKASSQKTSLEHSTIAPTPHVADLIVEEEELEDDGFEEEEYEYEEDDLEDASELEEGGDAEEVDLDTDGEEDSELEEEEAEYEDEDEYEEDEDGDEEAEYEEEEDAEGTGEEDAEYDEDELEEDEEEYEYEEEDEDDEEHRGSEAA